MKTKQVIIIRKDLKMRRGKEIAQGSHASMAFITRRLNNPSGYLQISCLKLKPVEIDWLNNIFTKVVCTVNSEEELLRLHKQAQEIGLESHLITDCGLTEFNNKPTITCLAIGPDESEKIDNITGHLKLY